MSQLISTPKIQAFDDNGDPLSGGFIYFFISGTSTPKNTYSDSALTIPNTNPVELNARGEANVYGSGQYKVVLNDSDGVQIYSSDEFYFEGFYKDQLKDDLASTATDDGTKGFHLVNYPPLSGETGVTDFEYPVGDVRRYGVTVADSNNFASRFWSRANALFADFHHLIK